MPDPDQLQQMIDKSIDSRPDPARASELKRQVDNVKDTLVIQLPFEIQHDDMNRVKSVVTLALGEHMHKSKLHLLRLSPRLLLRPGEAASGGSRGDP